MEQNTIKFLKPLISSFLIFSYIILFYMNSVPTCGFTNETDMQALLSIREGIQEDPFGVFSSWNNSLHFCKWQGVSCSQRHHQRVSALNLSSLKLVGSLSPHVGNLTFLRLIDLNHNSFRGVIPQEKGRLFRIRSLHLGYNSFEGEFPVNVTQCSDLRVLRLAQNNLGGKLPTQLGSLPKLVALRLSLNHFFGIIPPALGNLSALRVIYMAYNNLQGQIPIELGNLSNLEGLQLSANKLTGIIPPTIYNISTIRAIAVVTNQLHGCLPSNLGLILPKLEGLYIGKNQFSGTIPASLTNASGLVEIDLSINAFTGSIPQNLGDLQQLLLNFGGNPLGAKKANDLNFLTSLTNCTNLRLLLLYKNKLGEYAIGGEVSIKGDVYSYGILLLEMFTGKRPTDNMFINNFNLHNYAKRVSADLVMETVDPLLILEGQNESNWSNGSIRGNVATTVKCLGSILQIGVYVFYRFTK